MDQEVWTPTFDIQAHGTTWHLREIFSTLSFCASRQNSIARTPIGKMIENQFHFEECLLDVWVFVDAELCGNDRDADSRP